MRMNIRILGCFWLCFVVVGCPFADPVDRAMDSGCALCPPGHRCEGATGDSPAGDPVVKCIPDLESVEEDGSNVSDLLSERNDVCLAFGCKCINDEDCNSRYCISVEGISFCSVPCAAGCVEVSCPDSCPGESACIEDDEGHTSCAP